MKHAFCGIKYAFAGVLALAFGAPVVASTGAPDPDAAVAWQELRVALAKQLRSDADPRRQVIASMLLSLSMSERRPADEHAGVAAKHAEAQAIFARARAATDDSWILWVAATGCQLGPQPCDTDDAIDRLLRIEPHNAAVWQLALDRAYRAKDTDAMLVALHGMASSKRHDTFFIDTLREWSSAVAKLEAMPELDHLVRRYVGESDPGARLTRSELIDLMRLNGFSVTLAFFMPPAAIFSQTCKPELLADSVWIEACKGAARPLFESDTLLGVLVGTSVAHRMATSDEERARIERLRLRVDWLMESVNRFELDGVDPSRRPDPAEARELVDRWLAAPSEIEAMRTLLRDRGVPLEPPPDYKGRGPSLAERESEQMQQRR